MKFYNLKENDEQVSFAGAVKQGLGKNQGLFFPETIPVLDNIDELLAMPLVERSVQVLYPFVEGDLTKAQLTDIVTSAFNFPAQIQPINKDRAILELFHGPTLAFKDFGARFMAKCLQVFSKDKKITILTATSGDTGAAVAHAFHNVENIRVVILYPKGKISLLQEKMFTTLGGNIETLAIDGSFDDCQALVKKSFDDKELATTIGLNSANSINISRLLAQVCYYFEGFAQLSRQKCKTELNDVVVSIPSGNFGNLTAGLFAKALGLPIKRFIAATNANDTVPRYLKTGEWTPHTTVATISNAMDVSDPNNWPRVEHMLKSGIVPRDCVNAVSIDEEQTQSAVLQLAKLGYISEPHAAIAYKALQYNANEDEFGVFLGTAHPAKFKDVVESILGQPIGLPKELADCASETILSKDMAANFSDLHDYLLLNDH
ncbi:MULTISPECIES: threonine synthase [unclassified Colwellia]|uniref:threonine synthase n=1 Tax=unclassified Colwellia TaxID=196834 RepID=UPI0015F5B737|nr:MULTISPECIES: threonine synthase [unclassified Colwellia]MBA6233170.1 threonine synthase [Colwellia sp. MB02u-7]MBA6236260.1 threonine synthase [Colwellia sp. MB02u-11]MBA6256799.1 threonine synthase [Colwellia sp. MB3u-28]MBA6261195.1 threonine synthase [Colwellia sp. MB3u-41]MBA6298340.1 threonine synthase [Colwellia sp. MB3u-22]